MERWLFYLSSVAFLCLLARKAFSQECAEPLGMENSAIADAQISASSVYSGRHVARNARLNFATNPGCWSAKVKDLKQWLQVVFNSETKITRIATQGRYSGSGRSQWVTNYTLQYKNDGDAFEVYKQAGETSEKFFKGNNDSDTIVYHHLNPPITVRYIRVLPKSWHTHISMRMELYGCQEDQYCRELKFTTVIKETALRKHVIRTIDGIEEDLCGAKCFMENNCVSYNFLNAPSGGETCELNNYTANEHPEHLEVTTGSLYKGSPNACGNMPCKNNATCQTGFTGKGYRCLCAEGFLGVECEVDIDECASIPCQNGGSCQDLVNSYTCTCLPGYHGSQCQQEPVECSTYTPLTSADRRESGRAINLCDAHLNGWYRFTGDAGTQMLEHCLNTYDRCSASYPGYLVGGQPTAEEGQASRSVCFYNGGCDQQCRNILVRKCVTFLVYRFESVDEDLCGFRYCGST